MEAIVIGAGLAGSEAALQLAKRGIKVKLFEMRPQKQPALMCQKIALSLYAQTALVHLILQMQAAF